jgi:4-amino-4-deoxy-L-arabinose transferase-like glycosyltransferase
MKINSGFAYLIAILAGLILFIPFLGGVHLFDWDEINFAESAREMMVTGNYLTVQINYEAFWEKPPLFFWLQVLSVKLFGLNEFAMRFPNAIAGILSLIVIFRVGRRVIDEKFGLLWMFVYTGSILPFFYFKSGIIDPWFNLLTFLGIVHFSYYFIFKEQRIKNLVFSALFTGLAIITKGPVAILILILVFIVYLVMMKARVNTSFKDVAIFSIVLIFTGSSWFILQMLNGNLDIIKDFIVYQVRLFTTEDAGHGGFFLYHVVILFFGVFPASVFALPAIFGSILEFYRSKSFGLWMRILFWTVLILFSIVDTKIIHYSSLCYFPLTFLGSKLIYRVIQEKDVFRKYQKTLMIIVSFIYAIAVVIITLVGKFKDELPLEKWFSKDPFALANLSADVHWSGWEVLIGLLYLTAFLYIMFGLKKMLPRIMGIFAATLVYSYATILFITPKIEGYTQRAAIEFYKTLENKDVYVGTLGFKSYAHLYYSRVQPPDENIAVNTEWLLEGEVDKPVFFVFKIHRKDRYLEQYPQLELLYEKNGFVFTKRVIND